MNHSGSILDDVADVVESLDQLGLHPVLVGGMALALLGSQRVTRDFDLVVSHPRGQIEDVVGLFYDRGMELVSKLNAAGDVTATIDNPKVAAIRIRLDQPNSVFFLKPGTLLRIDLLFDFPVAASELRAHSVQTKVRSRVLEMACNADLLRLKEIAAATRSRPGDAEDIAFLKARQVG